MHCELYKKTYNYNYIGEGGILENFSTTNPEDYLGPDGIFFDAADRVVLFVSVNRLFSRQK